MDNILVNTPGIAGASSQLKGIQSAIDSDFNILWGKMQSLNNWRGMAGEAALTTMHQFPPNNDARTAVLQNYVDMLEKQINPCHDHAETVNQNLADRFM